MVKNSARYFDISKDMENDNRRDTNYINKMSRYAKDVQRRRVKINGQKSKFSYMSYVDKTLYNLISKISK